MPLKSKCIGKPICLTKLIHNYYFFKKHMEPKTRIFLNHICRQTKHCGFIAYDLDLGGPSKIIAHILACKGFAEKKEFYHLICLIAF